MSCSTLQVELPGLTIEQLAERAGITVRNVRAHQARGLLPGPRLQGRSGRYGAEHLSRLRVIRELQQAGLNLHAIAWLLERASAGGCPLDVFDERCRCGA